LKKSRIFLAFLLVPFTVSAQLEVDLDASPESIVQNTLLGEGVELLDVTFNGNSASAMNPQMGTFYNGLQAIGISDGVILSTGNAEIAEGPNDLPTAFSSIDENELTVEPDLSILMGQSVDLNDVAVLEFDFVASGDTLKFSYVFASEEYNEHTCSPYNDAFGFFISGPGVSGDGTFTNNAINVARIPGTNLPVAINTVNNGTAGEYGSNAICNSADPNWQSNSQYFVDNESNTDLNTTQFDGFTKVMRVEVPVVCGGTYHIKMAIADAVDGKNDSAVFLESNSFQSAAPLEVDYEVLNPIDNMAIEGCSGYDFHLTRGDSSAVKTVYLESDFANNNPDLIPNFPDSIVFYPAQGHLEFQQEVLANGIFEDERVFDIRFLEPNVCGFDTSVTELLIPLTDRPNLTIEYTDILNVSCDETAFVDINVSGGVEPYTIEWDGNYSGFQFEIDQESPIQLNATVTDLCGINSEDIQINYSPIEYEPLEVILPPLVEFNCLNPLTQEPVVSGGRGDYTFEWRFQGSIISGSQVLTIPNPEEGRIHLMVSDGCMPADSSHMDLELIESPISASIGDDFFADCNQEIVIVPEVQGGIGGKAYRWKRNFATESYETTFSFVPYSSSVVTLEVTDQCGQKGYDTLNVSVENIPIDIDMPADTAICAGRRLLFTPKVSGGFGDMVFNWTGVTSDSLTIDVVPRVEEVYTLEVVDECLKRAQAEMVVRLVDVSADFEFNYESPDFPLINNSLSGLAYHWTLPGGETSQLYEPVFEPSLTDDQLVSLEVTHPFGCTDTKIDFYEPPLNIFIPTAFTPDGDGLNDIFKAEGTFIVEYDLWVFDRWGNTVFHTNDPEEGWNGGDSGAEFTVESSIYSYRVLAKGYNSQIIDKKGSVTVLR
jgi:gliding motility-associated-like protein